VKLENQVCSLKLAKKLKKLGVKQESAFVWQDSLSYGWEFRAFVDRNIQMGKGFVSAFTVAELGEMLPDRVRRKGDKVYPYNFVKWPMPDPMHGWKSYIWKPEGFSIPESNMLAKTEANCRAIMLIYLIENKLISLND